jgi:hypothetical protein
MAIREETETAPLVIRLHDVLLALARREAARVLGAAS